MKRLIFSTLIILFFSVKKGQCQWEVVLGMQVKQALDNFGLQIKSATDNAGAMGNYVVENAANKTNLLLQNAFYLLDKQLDKRVERLSDENQKFIKTIYDLTNQLKGVMDGVLELEDFLILDIQNIINQLPFSSDKYLIRRIQGYSLTFQENGIYTVKIVGGAYGPDFINEITVNNNPIEISNIRSSQANTLEFDIPVSFVNDLFKETTTNRFTVSIKSKKWMKRTFGSKKLVEIFTYEDSFILLPLFPVNSYVLTETYKEKKWSDETFWSEEGHSILPQTGKEFRWLSGSVSASIPEGCLMIKDQFEHRATPGTHMNWGALSYSNGDKTIRQDASHFIHDQPTHLYIKVKYRKPLTINSTRNLSFENNGVEFPTKLRYGIYLSTFSDSFINFTLQLTMFNGKKYTITPSSNNNSIFSFRLESMGEMRRLVLEIKQL